MSDRKVIVVGAGIGGLAAAITLASKGLQVRVIERDDSPGGKLRPVHIDGVALDAGPTVFTMRSVFDELFGQAGQHFDRHLRLTPLNTLARHVWQGNEQLDLHADLDASAAEIGHFAGARAAAQYLDFCNRSKRTFDTLEPHYLRAQRPTPVSLAWRCGLRGLPGLLRISPFLTLWKELGRSFDDPRLRQLFARYATYGGSSPMAAPATLMLIAHVERTGVWSIDGGMHKLASVMMALAQSLGVHFEFQQSVARLCSASGKITGVVLERGESLTADAVVFNGDVAALAQGLLGDEARGAVPPMRASARSLSALTWNLRTTSTDFDLLRHTVFFSRDYVREFDDLFTHHRLPEEPTIYVCAQDRLDAPPSGPHRAERLLCLINAPARADIEALTDKEIAACETRTFRRLSSLGLTLNPAAPGSIRHQPADWGQRFAGTGGALYGQATHGWRASFSRPGARSRLPGLYLAGGSTHPGAGVPMAALSGMLAARQLLTDTAGRTSTSTWRTAAMPGGTSMR
jgi:1-hydroxycarotenoid 3,4-desaturase